MEYFRLNPKELNKLVKYFKGEPIQPSQVNQCESKGTPSTQKSLVFISHSPIHQADVFGSSPIKTTTFYGEERKPDPFYISLLLKGHKLINYIIESITSKNTMPSSFSKSLGLTLTKTFGRCYSMDGK